MIIIYCYTRFLIQICTISQSINTYGKLSMRWVYTVPSWDSRKKNENVSFSANHQAEIRRLAILVMGLIIAFLICWTPVELIALIHFTGKAGMLCENACRTAKNVRNSFQTIRAPRAWSVRRSVWNHVKVVLWFGFRRVLIQCFISAWAVSRKD